MNIDVIFFMVFQLIYLSEYGFIQGFNVIFIDKSKEGSSSSLLLVITL